MPLIYPSMAMEPNGLNNARKPAQTDNGPQSTPGECSPQVCIPDHQLLRRIGSGSYGEVWVAQHTMGMHRAVKIVYRASFKDQRPYERELSGIRKFEPISRSHEGFVDVLHVGIDSQQGYFYYLMELGDDQVSGQKIEPETYCPKTLDKEISQKGRLSLQECVQLGLALSRALSELHKHELVHRDIKPSNIIFVNGVPKLADIGLVAEMREARSYVGTEGFIPPEGPGAPPADVYSLGKVLYEASTGKDRKEFPGLPDGWDHSPEHAGLLELNEIILQACQNDVSKRYASAGEMHADLVVLENGKSVKRLKLLERRLANLKRVVGVMGLVCVVLVLIAHEVYQGWLLKNESRQRQVGADVAYGNRAMESSDLLGALPFFADALRLDQGNWNLEINHRLRFGSTLAQCPKLTQMWFLPKDLCDGQFSPDGMRVLLAERYGKTRIYDVQTGEMYSHPFGQMQGLAGAVYSPDGRFIVTSSEDGTVCVWDATNLEQLRVFFHPAWVFSARCSPDGLRIVTSCGDGLARVWDARTGRTEPLLKLKRHIGPVRFATFSHAGRLILTAGEDGNAYLWAAADGQPVGRPLKHPTWVTYAAFSPDDQRVATVSDDHQARIWDVSTGKQVLLDLNHQDVVKSAEFSPDGHLIVTADLGGEVHLWNAETSQPLSCNPVLRHGERVTHACFSPDGRQILTTCTDGSARIWDLAGFSRPPLPVRGSYSQDGSRLFTLTNGAPQVWDATSGEAVSLAIEPGALVREPGWTRDGRYIQSICAVPFAAAITNHLVQVWDASNGRSLSPGVLVSNAFTGAALSEDGSRMLTFGGRTAQIWDVRAGAPLSPPLVPGGPVASAIFSPTGERIATRSGTQVQVWDANSGRPAFSPLRVRLNNQVLRNGVAVHSAV